MDIVLLDEILTYLCTEKRAINITFIDCDKAGDIGYIDQYGQAHRKGLKKLIKKVKKYYKKIYNED